MNLEEIALALDTSLAQEERATDTARYQRAKLYEAAKNLKPSPKEFKAWLDELEANQRIDNRGCINDMIQVAKVLNQHTYVKLGWSNARILTAKWLWKDFPGTATELVEKAIAESWTVKQCREAIQAITLPEKATESTDTEDDENLIDQTEITPPPTREQLLETVHKLAAENMELKQEKSEPVSENFKEREKQWVEKYNTLFDKYNDTIKELQIEKKITERQKKTIEEYSKYVPESIQTPF